MSRRLLCLIAVTTLAACGSALAKPRVIIRWSKDGGFAGTSQVLRIRSDNVALAGPRGENPYPVQLSKARVAKLREKLEAANLAGSQRHYPAPGAADTYQYSVTYRGHTVDGDETALPARIMRAMRALDRLYDYMFSLSE
jgi:hypothetical protein